MDALPNPRAFIPVRLPSIDFYPAESTSPIPETPEKWLTGVEFPQSILMPDGVSLAARCWLPPGPPAPLVILLHMWGMDAHAWDRRAPGLLTSLSEMGFAWCAHDLRWHGASGGEPHCATYAEWRQGLGMHAGPEKLARLATLAEMGPPLGANVQFLPDLMHVTRYFAASGRTDPDRTALLGASVGANLAWVASSLYSHRAHVCVSPWYPSPGFSLMGREVDPFVPKNCLFIADREESAEAELMAQRTTGEAEVIAVDIKEHGIGLLRRLAVRRRVLEWLMRRLV